VIDAFQPVSTGCRRQLAARSCRASARLHSIDGKKAEVGNGEQAAKIAREIEQGSFRGDRRAQSRSSRRRPSSPAAATGSGAPLRLRSSARWARAGLYEGREIGDRGSVGLIAHMRTD
jgi:hypothetical protein